MRFIYEDWDLIPNTVRGRIEVDYIKQGRSKHAIKTGADYFVLYPYRNGKPFIFEKEK